MKTPSGVSRLVRRLCRAVLQRHTTDLFFDGQDPFAVNDSKVFGGFAGYQHQSGSVLYGAEPALVDASDAVLPDFPELNLTDPGIDINPRAGRSFGDILAYGVIDISSLEVSDDVSEGTGAIVGIRMNDEFNDRIRLGAAYLL